MKIRQSLILGLVVLLFMVSCNRASVIDPENRIQTTTPSFVVVPTETPKFSTEIQISQNKWESTGIKSYHIQISFFENFLSLLTTERDVIVNNGEIVNSFCISDKCPAFVLVDVYTIDDLFGVAKGATLAKLGFPDGPTLTYNNCVREISFEKDYGFPKSMSVDCPDAYDENHSFQVILFEVLE